MLEVNPDTVCFLISCARLFHAKEDLVLPDVPDSPADDWGLEALEEQANDSSFLEFRSTIRDLEPVQQQAVVALLWLGRGDYGVTEWNAAMEEARGVWNRHTAEYLIVHPMLADHLLEGLNMLGYSCEA